MYVAVDPDGFRVVIRTLKKKYAGNRRIRNKFLNGAEVLSGLEHPNIIRQLHYGRSNGTPYMVLEYVESCTLRELIIQRAPLLTENTFSLLRQMAESLYYLHSSGFIHLDFKPDNLLVTPYGLVVLIDFDLATNRPRSPVRMRESPGTPAYVAPEILTTQLADERADIYSLGVTAYEMIAFHKPFERTTQDESYMAQINPCVKPTPFKSHGVHPPPAVESLISKCLAKNPDNRYPAMSLVVKNLEAIL